MSKPLPADQTRTLRQRWEQRAHQDGSSKSSVLFRGLPENINQYIHDFHQHLLLTHYLPELRAEAEILDLGCGYGRITSILKTRLPQARITGLDFSEYYCRLFLDQSGCHAVCADLMNTPFAAGKFDSVIAVTSLMYVAAEQRRQIVRNIAMLLKPGGSAFVLDPGREFAAVVTFISPSRQKKSTGGEGFTNAEYDHLFDDTDLHLVKAGGMSFFSLAMPLILLLQGFRPVLKPLLKLTFSLDRLFSPCRFLSLHKWMIVKKPPASGEAIEETANH